MLDKLFSIENWSRMYKKYSRIMGWGLAVVFGVPLVIGFGMSQYSNRGSQNNAAQEQQNAVILRVNGQDILRSEVTRLSKGQQGAEPGERFASLQGQIVDQLITLALVQQEATQRKVRPSDNDIEKYLQQERAATMPKGASDAEWEQRVEEAHGASLAEYREQVAKQLIPMALIQSYQNDEKVSEAEAKNQTAEVRLTMLVIAGESKSPFMPKPKNALSDDAARKKAEALLAQVRAGANLPALVRANSSDSNTSKTGGDTNWRPEYQGQPRMPESMGVMGYGADFDNAVHVTAIGQYTPVVKITGMTSGFGFAQVTSRRNTPPKNFDVKAVIQSLQTERARKKLMAKIAELKKTAKIDFKDLDYKAYYDYIRLRMMQQQSMMAQFGGSSEPVPPQAEIDKLQADTQAEFEAMLVRHKDDATAALLVAENLRRKRVEKGTTPEQAAQMRDRLIQLYETALTTAESRDIRFDLADLYREKQLPDQAAKQYLRIQHYMDQDPPYDLKTMQEAKASYDRLETGLRSVQKLPEADKVKAEVAKLTVKIAEETKKEKEAQKPPTNLPTTITPDGKVTSRSVVVPPKPGTPGKPAAETNPKGAKAAETPKDAKTPEAPKSGTPAGAPGSKPAGAPQNSVPPAR